MPSHSQKPDSWLPMMVRQSLSLIGSRGPLGTHVRVVRHPTHLRPELVAHGCALVEADGGAPRSAVLLTSISSCERLSTSTLASLPMRLPSANARQRLQEVIADLFVR